MVVGTGWQETELLDNRRDIGWGGMVVGVKEDKKDCAWQEEETEFYRLLVLLEQRESEGVKDSWGSGEDVMRQETGRSEPRGANDAAGDGSISHTPLARPGNNDPHWMFLPSPPCGHNQCCLST